MLSNLESSLLAFAEQVPLSLFAFCGSFLEEVIAPIPSSGVLLATGTLAAAQGISIFGLLPLILLATLGKTAGALLIFILAKKLGSRFIDRFGRYFSITNAAISDFGAKRLTGKNQFWSLLILRMLPIFPSAVLSVGCGVLHIQTRLFITTTILGTIVRDSIFLVIGFTGVELLQRLANVSATIESYIQIALIVVIIGVSIFLLRKSVLSYKRSTTK